MIVKEEFLSKLRRYFSLNLYEVKIWTALLSRGTSTAGELSSISDVPRSRRGAEGNTPADLHECAVRIVEYAS